jgi:hypothetical protein
MTGPKSDFWAIVGGLTGLAGVIVAIFGLFFRHYDASKALEVTLASRSQLLNPEIHGKSPALQLLFNGKEVPDVGILQVRICNSGVQPISKTDFEEPIQFTSDRNQLSISGEGTEIGVSAGVGVDSDKPSFRPRYLGAARNRPPRLPEDAFRVRLRPD